ncbi:MAG: hypothetical protein ACM37W_27990 [Actinomycetota bacterium]
MEFKAERVSSHWLGLLLPGAVAVSAFVGVVAMQLAPSPVSLNQAQQSVSAQQAVAFRQATQQEALRLKLLKVFPTFGFDNLVADWTFLKFIQYFGDDEARSVTGYELSQEYFDSITRRDPRWVDIYPFLSTSISFYQAKPKLAIELMDRGINVLSPQIAPKAWQVARLKGIDQLLLLGDVPGAIRSHEIAAEWVKGTPDREIEPLLRQTVQYLRQDPDSTLVRFNAWLSIYGISQDKLVRERAKREILALGGQILPGENGEIRFFLPSAAVKDRKQERSKSNR